MLVIGIIISIIINIVLGVMYFLNTKVTIDNCAKWAQKCSRSIALSEAAKRGRNVLRQGVIGLKTASDLGGNIQSQAEINSDPRNELLNMFVSSGE